MDRLAAMRTFTLVVDQGSFAAAARQLDVDQALVTRQVAALEKHLGTRLLERTTRSMRLTEAGEMYLGRCRDILQNLEEAEAQVSQSHVAMEGRIRMAVPTLFGKTAVACQVVNMRKNHPRLMIDMAMLDRAIDPVAEGFDVVIADAALPVSPTAISRPVLQVPLWLCAAPGVAVPQHPDELRHVPVIAQWTVGEPGQPVERWRLTQAQTGEVREIEVSPVVRANNYALSLEAVVRGLGIGRFTPRIASEEIERGALQRVLPDWHAGSLAFNLIYPSRRLLPQRVRAVIDAIVAQFDGLAPAPEPGSGLGTD